MTFALASQTTGFINGIRSELVERRNARSAVKALRSELAVYTTEAEISDLLNTLSEAQGRDAALVRSILLENAAAAASVRTAA